MSTDEVSKPINGQVEYLEGFDEGWKMGYYFAQSDILNGVKNQDLLPEILKLKKCQCENCQCEMTNKG